MIAPLSRSKPGRRALGATAIAIAISAARWRRKRDRRVASALTRTRRSSRNLATASLAARVGADSALTRARTVFASAERTVELRDELQLRTAAQVTETLGEMKGALMKLGQMLSFIDEGLPEPVRLALTSLQASAPPMSAELAAQVVEAELGRPPDQLFDRWDEQPLAAASIGQVHRAVTKDGHAVAVKVQYPGVADAIRADLANAGVVFGSLALAYPSFDPGPVIAELRTRVSEELDYRREATNQALFANFYAGHPFITVPRVHTALSTSRVLVTDLAAGSTFAQLETWDQHERDLAGEALYRFVFRSLYRLQAFNGDPHPGNYLFHGDGKVTFVDFGLVRTFDDTELGRFRAMITAMVVDRDPEAFRRAVIDAGLLAPDAPLDTDEVTEYFRQFYKLVEHPGPVTAGPEYSSATVRQTFNRDSPVTRYTTVPPSFVLIQRINLGLFALLGRLRTTLDYRRVTEEIWPWVNGPPTTALGEAEARWIAQLPTRR